MIPSKASILFEHDGVCDVLFRKRSKGKKGDAVRASVASHPIYLRAVHFNGFSYAVLLERGEEEASEALRASVASHISPCGALQRLRTGEAEGLQAVGNVVLRGGQVLEGAE